MVNLAVPYHVVSNAELANALGARAAINQYLGIPFQNTMLLSQQTYLARVIRNQFRTILPVPEPSAVSPTFTQLGRYGVLGSSVFDPFITFTGIMGYGQRGEEVDGNHTPAEGEIYIDANNELFRYPDVPTGTYNLLQLERTLALVSALVTERVSAVPFIVNDVSPNENVIPRTVVSGLEPILDGFS